MARQVYNATVHCDRCHGEQRLRPMDGVPLRDVAFTVACWLHSAVACGHAGNWSEHTRCGAGGMLLCRQDDIRCIQCHGAMSPEWITRRRARVASFLPKSRISVHYMLCQRCRNDSPTGDWLCPRQLVPPLQCNRVAAKLALLCSHICLSGEFTVVCDYDWLCTVGHYMCQLLRRDGSCCLPHQYL